MRRRIGLALIALLSFLLSSELLLQALSLAARAGVGWRARESEAGAIKILAVGDSHTYGAPLPREDAYPAQLERRLADELPDRRVQVLNRGVPGVNSAFVVKHLEQLIALHDPDLVIVWVGTNNRWNVLDAEGWGGSGPFERLHRALLHVKLYRLARVLQSSLADSEDAVAVMDPYLGYTVDGSPVVQRRREGRLAPGEHAAGLALDLERIAGTARSLGRPVIFVTYPLASQNTASDTIASTGARLGVPVVDTRLSFAHARAEGERTGDLIVMAAGPHPTRRLYAYVVEDMLPRVIEALPEAALASPRRSSRVAPAPARPGTTRAGGRRGTGSMRARGPGR